MKNFITHRYTVFVIEFAIATAITFGIYHYKPQVMQYFHKGQIIKQIQKAVDFVKSDHDSYGNYDRINNNYTALKAKDNLQKYGLVFHYDGIVSSYYGGNFLVFPSTRIPNSGQHDAFVLGYGALWQDRCIFLATYDWRKIKNVTPVAVLASSMERYTQFLDQAHVVGCTDKSLIGSYSLTCADNMYSFPMTLEEAKSACSCNANTCFVAVKFY